MEIKLLAQARELKEKLAMLKNKTVELYLIQESHLVL